MREIARDVLDVYRSGGSTAVMNRFPYCEEWDVIADLVAELSEALDREEERYQTALERDLSR